MKNEVKANGFLIYSSIQVQMSWVTQEDFSLSLDLSLVNNTYLRSKPLSLYTTFTLLLGVLFTAMEQLLAEGTKRELTEPSPSHSFVLSSLLETPGAKVISFSTRQRGCNPDKQVCLSFLEKVQYYHYGLHEYRINPSLNEGMFSRACVDLGRQFMDYKFALLVWNCFHSISQTGTVTSFFMFESSLLSKNK